MFKEELGEITNSNQCPWIPGVHSRLKKKYEGLWIHGIQKRAGVKFPTVLKVYGCPVFKAGWCEGHAVVKVTRYPVLV